MGLFGFGKKKEEKSACCGADTRAAANGGCACGEASGCACGGNSGEQTSGCACGGQQTPAPAPACACNGDAPAFEASASKTGAAPGGLVSVKVLGSGCKSCHTLLVNTNEALHALGVPFEAEYVTDLAVIAGYGVMSTPALVVNEKVVSMGKVYSAAEVEKLLHKLGW